LKAVSVLDIEVVAKILEEHEEAQILKHEVVRKFLKQMELAGHHGKEGLKNLFNEVDTDHSGNIDSREFKQMLNSQQVFFTNKMFLHLFHVFDVDNDNSISLEELENICFPPIGTEETPLYHSEDIAFRKQNTNRDGKDLS
jgi:Ca2+-binding EF-hand superfamily protein